ncbi:hypothetical protein KI387_036087, partial [Taxus chinensis]
CFYMGERIHFRYAGIYNFHIFFPLKLLKEVGINVQPVVVIPRGEVSCFIRMGIGLLDVGGYR